MKGRASPLDIEEVRDRASLEAARRVIAMEIDGLKALSAALTTEFPRAVELLHDRPGRIILSGIGKSGHVARKIAATFASTGAPAQYVHPSEASHGDLGMIAPEDAVIMLSKSGENRELGDVIAYTSRFSTPLVAMTANPASLLGRAADIVLALPDAPEACVETRAPTTSTTMMMALGDALAVALLERRGFSAERFRIFHPGGALNAALAKASDLMHGGEELPLVAIDAEMSQALIEMTAKGLGCVGVLDADGRLAGIVTDGDLRRHMGPDLVSRRVGDVMTGGPRTVAPSALAADAMRLMTAVEPRVLVLFVVEDARPVGVIHMHDLLRAGVA
ncbi:MAG: KpsF/GutQ family sugar-phosphate isomerase [Caulobacterales bacterium]|nr:KpsF/GutQ family sugar-phosphate isomerase [Caulobacterales bacterium]